MDRLYGQVTISDEWQPILQTSVVTRLRHLSLSAVNPWFLPVSTCASKFEHSLGVVHLAEVATANPSLAEFKNDLLLAALVHDVGTPPFSHVSELWQQVVTGGDHEQAAIAVLTSSELTDEISKLGSDPEKIAELVTGQKPPLSQIMNGSIDLDNLDNTLRFGISTGLLADKLYDPVKMAEAFSIQQDQFGFSHDVAHHVAGWEKVRQVVYNFVNSEPNDAPAAMLLRAMDFAYRAEELTEDFFTLTDEEALHFLLHEANETTKDIASRLNHWQFYQLVARVETAETPKIPEESFRSIQTMCQLSDQLAEDFSLPPEDCFVYLAKNKGFKHLDIPIFEQSQQNDDTIQHSQTPTWIAEIFVAPDHSLSEEDITSWLATRQLWGTLSK